MSDKDKNIEYNNQQEDEQNKHDLIDDRDEFEQVQDVIKEDMEGEEEDVDYDQEIDNSIKINNNSNFEKKNKNRQNNKQDSELESTMNDNENVNNHINEDITSKLNNEQSEPQENEHNTNSIKQTESPEHLLKKLEVIKEIKTKTLSLQRLKSRLAQEVESFEQETKCLHNCQTELELLTQEKLAHLEELRQIQYDIATMESTIKQADEEKRKALDMVRRLHTEYRPLKEQINNLRETIGLDKTDKNDDVDIIEAFLNKFQPFNEKSNKLNTSNDSKSNNTSDNRSKSKNKHDKTNKHDKNESSSSSLSPIQTKNASSNNKLIKEHVKINNNTQITSPQQQNLLKSQSIDLPLQLATVALMAHSLRSKSPPNPLLQSAQQTASLPFNVFANQLEQSQETNAANALKQFNQFVLNQSKQETSNSHSSNSSNNNNNNNIVNNSSGSQLQSIPPPSFRQQPPPMKSCLSCGQQIHRNAPICPLCKAKSRSRNPKKPKGQKETMINDLSPSSSSSNINYNTSIKNFNTSQKVKQHGDRKNRC